MYEQIQTKSAAIGGRSPEVHVSGADPRSMLAQRPREVTELEANVEAVFSELNLLSEQVHELAIALSPLLRDEPPNKIGMDNARPAPQAMSPLSNQLADMRQRIILQTGNLYALRSRLITAS